MAQKKNPESNVDFESKLKELQNIVEQMEQGKLSLEQSLQQFEQGVKLTRACQTELKEAEQKVRILLEKNEQAELAEYQGDDE